MIGTITGNITHGLSEYNNTTNSTKSDAISTTKTNYIPLLIIAAIVVIENSIVCLAFAVNGKLRERQSNMLKCSQAASDFLVGIALVPWYVVQAFTVKNLHVGSMIFYILFVSLGNLFSLAMDRYLALVKPLKHRHLMNADKTKKILLVVWLAPLFLTMIPISWYSASFQTQIPAMKIYLSIFWVFIFIMCTVMIAMYIKAYRTAARSIHLGKMRADVHNSADNQIKTAKKELRVAHLFGLLLTFFILGYTPLLYVNFADIIGYVDPITPIMYQVSLHSYVINSAINPIICVSLKRDYQQTIKQWIHLSGVRNEDETIEMRACNNRAFERERQT